MNKLTGALLIASLGVVTTTYADDERAAADAKYAEARAREAAALQRESQIRNAPEPKATPEPKSTPEPKDPAK